MYPHGRDGHALVDGLVAEVRRRPAITVLTGAEVVSKAGTFGNYRVGVRVGDPGSAAIEVAVGSIIIGDRLRLPTRPRPASSASVSTAS